MRPVALLLPGQGAQHPGMAVDLYVAEPLFAKAIDALFEEMGEEGRRLRTVWLSSESGSVLDEGTVAQPLLFAIDYALGRCLEEYGIRPAAYLGHSVGELAGAALANVLGDGGAAKVMAARARCISAIPDGGMIAVAAAPAALVRFVDPPGRADGVVVAAQNAPMHTVLAGPEPRLSQVGAALESAGLAWRRVPARQAFHSAAARPAARVFQLELARLPLQPPDVPVWSTRTGQPARPEEAVDPEFWAGQLARPVLFRQALDGLLDSGPLTIIEAGPSQSLSMFARRHRCVREGKSVVIPLLSSGRAGTLDAWHSALTYLGKRRSTI